jgi:uridine phosphorylase
MAEFPILEYDPDRDALISPSVTTLRPSGGEPIPRVAVACFFQEVIESECVRAGARVVATLTAEHGTHPVYAVERGGQSVAVFHPGVGAPLAVGFLEEVIALGVRAVVACGGAGAVSTTLDHGHDVLVSSAVRDEGTSYHYQPPSREIVADPATIRIMTGVLEDRGVPFVVGKTWTTDALYRETRGRIARRAAEGCLTVEMEASAFLAAAAFRGVRFASLLYAGDDVSGDQWDPRRWTHNRPVRKRLFDVAIDSALALAGPEDQPGSPRSTYAPHRAGCSYGLRPEGSR